MIAHVILFRPKPELTSADREGILRTLTSAANDIPGVRRFRVGRRIRHGLPGYEQAMREDFEFVVIIEVDDVDALKAYLAHPSHAAFGSHFTQSAAAALAYDYELVDASEAETLLGTEVGFGGCDLSQNLHRRTRGGRKRVDSRAEHCSADADCDVVPPPVLPFSCNGFIARPATRRSKSTRDYRPQKQRRIPR